MYRLSEVLVDFIGFVLYVDVFLLKKNIYGFKHTIVYIV